jgi:DNA-binding GntR family transcriptional regulator
MNEPTTNSRELRYVLLTKTLLGNIAKGQYKVGELLPNEAQLCKIFGVSRTTVREALRIISEQGVVEKLHGIGTIVKNKEPRRNFVVSVNSANFMQYGIDTQLLMIDRKTFLSDATHVRLFGCQLGEKWHQIRGVRSPLGDELHPVSLLEIYLPDRFCEVAQQDMISDKPYHRRIMEHSHIPFINVEQEIQATAISAEIAQHLNVPKEQPGLFVLRRFIGPDNQLIQASVNTHPGDRFSYRFYMNQVR